MKGPRTQAESARPAPFGAGRRCALDEAELNRTELFDAAAIPDRLAQAPYTAGLADPGSVDADALRHTYFCFLVRQGLKFDELQRIVGPLDAREMQRYGEMMPRCRERTLRK